MKTLQGNLSVWTIILVLINLSAYKVTCAPTGYDYIEGEYVKIRPIIFVPGKGGSQIEAMVLTPPNPECSGYSSWYRLWMDLWTFFYGGVDCWADSMQIYYNKSAGTSRNAPGVLTRVPGWGKTDTIEYIDPSWTAWVLGNLGVYLHDFVEELVYRGYEREKSLRGAPYDFRYAPHSHPEFMENFTKLIEETYEQNENTKVLLVAHSLGGIFSTYFLNTKTQEWKDRYLAGLITANTPWAGTILATRMYTAGYNFEIDAIDRVVIRGQQRSYETSVFLMPRSPAWSDDEVLVSTPQKNFTVNEYEEFFSSLNSSNGWNVLQRVRNPDYDLRHPGIPLFCFYSLGIPTSESLMYESEVNYPEDRKSVV